MKSRTLLPMALLGSALTCFAQNSPETGIIGGINTGENVETKPQKSPPKRDYVVKQTFRQNVGGRSVTIEEVEPPMEKLKPVPVQNTQNKEQAVPSPVVETPPTELIIVSATVYGQGAETRSKVTVFNDGRTCTALTRADFRLMSGFTQFKANSRPYFIIANIVDAEAPAHRIGVTPFTSDRRIPTKGFVVTEIDAGDTSLRQVLGDLHSLYDAEKENLRAAYQKRKQIVVKPTPVEPAKPVTIRFWKRDMAKEQKERGAE